jgi:tetratricopeptide (TPR) repeat protein
MLLLTTRAAVCCKIFFAVSVFAADNPSFAPHVERTFTEAQTLIRKEPTNVAALIGFSTAAFNWAELTQKDSQRETIANQAIAAAREALRLEPTNATAHYWLAMNLGQLARTKTLGALSLVRQMETEFLEAHRLDEHVDYAGPDRSLGYLYRDAPGWPTSIGSKRKAREHLERAVQLDPDFPDNRLALLESFEQWSDRRSFDRQFSATEKCMAEAREKFTGPDWEQSWADWEKRWNALKAKAGNVGKQAPSKGAK